MRQGLGHGRARLLAGALALIAVLAACGGTTTNTQPAGNTTGTVDAVQAADRTKNLTFGINYGFTTLDPAKTNNPGGDAIWLRPLYDRLVTLASGPDSSTQLAPQLATEWTFANGDKDLQLTLRTGVTFEDGTPFDASVVKANLERYKGTDSSVASSLKNVERVEVVDPTHVTIHLTTVDPSIVWSFATYTVGMMVNPAAFTTDLTAKPAGTGPWTLVSAAKDGDVVYQRRADHWDKDAALVDQLKISTVPDSNARYNGARSKAYDVTFLSSPQDAQASSLTSEGFGYHKVVTPISYAVLMNAKEAPLDDVRVRKAVSMALDRKAISSQLLQGINAPSFQTFNPGFVGYDQALDVDPYDVDEAKKLIQEAGADGKTIKLLQQQTAPQDSLAQVVQEALGKIGLKVEITPLSATEARPAWRKGGYGAFVAPLIAQAEPSQTLNTSYLSTDNPAPPPPELAQQAAAAQVLPLGSDERTKAYQDINTWLQDNPVHAPIAQFTSVWLTAPAVVGWNQYVPEALGQVDFRRVGVKGA